MTKTAKTPTPTAVKVWNALVTEVKLHLASNNFENIQYGDLAKRIYGARYKGAVGLRWGLLDIHRRTDNYNRANKTKHPRLNSLPFNQKGTQPGIPRTTNPKKVWSLLAKKEPTYLNRLGVLLGYLPFSGPPALAHSGSGRLKDSAGPKGRGSRSSAVWEAKHSPFVEELAAPLRELGWTRFACKPWKPDLAYGRSSTNLVLIIEVKPDKSLHNLITAIGQIISYREYIGCDKFRTASIIAAPGMDRISNELMNVFNKYKIDRIDLDGDVRKQISTILTRHRRSGLNAAPRDAKAVVPIQTLVPVAASSSVPLARKVNDPRAGHLGWKKEDLQIWPKGHRD